MPTALLTLLALAGTPRPVTELAAAIDGARRVVEKKECTFAVEAPACTFAVKVSCTTPLTAYSYVMTVPLAKVDAKKSVLEENAGGFKGAWGVELNTDGDVIVTVTDGGQKTSGSSVALAFGATDDDQRRAKKVLATLGAAKKACR